RRPRCPAPRRTGAGRPHRDPGGRPGGDPRTARDPGGAARRRHRTPARSRPRPGTRGTRPRDRPGPDTDDRGTTTGRPGRSGPDRPPHRAGITHQHPPALRRRHRGHPDRAPLQIPGGAHRRQRQGRARHRRGTRRRTAGHARTGRRPGRPAERRTAPRRRLLRPGRTPRGRDVMIRVLLVDDQPLVRSGFRALIELEDDIEVVAEAADGQEALALAREHLPDIALVDIQMPVLDGIETTRRIAADPSLTGAHVVILTNYGLDEYVLEALRAGAAGFLVKDIQPEDFLHSIRVAARGDALLAPSITRRLIDRYVTQPLTASGTDLEELTPREREAVALVARGLSNDQIAARMVISPATAKTHVNRAMTKLHVRDRAQLVVLAYESGLVTPTP